MVVRSVRHVTWGEKREAICHLPSATCHLPYAARADMKDALCFLPANAALLFAAIAISSILALQPLFARRTAAVSAPVAAVSQARLAPGTAGSVRRTGRRNGEPSCLSPRRLERRRCVPCRPAVVPRAFYV